ncbi:kazrin-A-like isoform X3 [Oncorhynchus masou masou]|uniref:kazrin-A-like isoform X3 n=1 Tax=Oncorhynchus masou masou TaxID=90313 RepID=UPI003182FF64
MMEDNKQLAQRIDGAIQSASQEVTNLRSELSATSRRLAELGASSPPSPLVNNHQHHQHNHHDHDSLRYRDPAGNYRQKSVVSDICYQTEISSLMDFGTPDSSLDKVLLREEVAQLQEEVHLLRQMKDMLSKDLEETQGQGGCSSNLLSDTELRVQMGDKEQELDRVKEALQAMKSDRKRLKVEKADLVNQMQQLYTTLESREEQLRDFIRNYDQHRKESEDAVKALAKEKDVLEREKWDLRRQTKEATEQACILRSHMDMKENRIKELEAELTMRWSGSVPVTPASPLPSRTRRRLTGIGRPPPVTSTLPATGHTLSAILWRTWRTRSVRLRRRKRCVLAPSPGCLLGESSASQWTRACLMVHPSLIIT